MHTLTDTNNAALETLRRGIIAAGHPAAAVRPQPNRLVVEFDGVVLHYDASGAFECTIAKRIPGRSGSTVSTFGTTSRPYNVRQALAIYHQVARRYGQPQLATAR
ncbi:hypothetical protein [Nonomuraea salmonea]|uniref:Uncharacterized protein n=1 Tax=Nonomuraea salmonea TaxID=46181 RepID=A0ABV5P2R3_9ACTN